jgi:hypothetical protein
MVLGTPLPGENPPQASILDAESPLDGTVTYFALKKYLFFDLAHTYL